MTKLAAFINDPGVGALGVILIAGVVSVALSGNWLDPLLYALPALGLFFVRRPDVSTLRKVFVATLAAITLLGVVMGGVGLLASTAWSHTLVNFWNVISIQQVEPIKRGALPHLYPEYRAKEFYPKYHPRTLDFKADAAWMHYISKLNQGLASIDVNLSEGNQALIFTLTQMRPQHCPAIIQSLVTHERLSQQHLPLFDGVAIGLRAPRDRFYNEIAAIEINGQSFFQQPDSEEQIIYQSQSVLREPFTRIDLKVPTDSLRGYCEHHPFNEFAHATLRFEKLPPGRMNFIEELIHMDTISEAGPGHAELIDHMEKLLFNEEELAVLAAEFPQTEHNQERNTKDHEDPLTQRLIAEQKERRAVEQILRYDLERARRVRDRLLERVATPE